jgi:diguanylate cyclase
MGAAPPMSALNDLSAPSTPSTASAPGSPGTAQSQARAAAGRLPPNPADLAKAALRRLAQARREPTPENFAEAYAQEAGTAAAVDAGPGSAAFARQWAALLPRLAEGAQRRSKAWSSARRRESLARLVQGSGGDLTRLSQRLTGLLAAWESDTDAIPVLEAADAADPSQAASEPAASSATAAGGHTAGVEAGQGWPRCTQALQAAVCTALPRQEARARGLADRLSALSARLPAEGPHEVLVSEIEALCTQAERLLQHRHRLLEQACALNRELGRGLVELSDDSSWVQGQSAQLQARLADEPSVRSLRAAQTLLGQARERQARLHGERRAAHDALRQLLASLLEGVGELDAQTEQFEDRLARHAQAVQAAPTLDSLAHVVRELAADSSAVGRLVRSTRERLAGEHGRAQALQARVAALEAELRRISDEAMTDALTQVANRRGLVAQFDAVLAQRHAQPLDAPAPVLSVGLIDIDNFKRLNDSLGHAAGDKALKALASAVAERLRPGDHLARFGGEEFVVLLPATAAATAQEVLLRLQRSLTAALFMQDGREVFVTFSAGVTAWREGESLDAALERADEALYEAKRTGKNRTCLA